MYFSITFDTVKSEWSNVNADGSQVKLPKIFYFILLSNSARPDEMMHFTAAAFHLGLPYLQTYLYDRWPENKQTACSHELTK